MTTKINPDMSTFFKMVEIRESLKDFVIYRGDQLSEPFRRLLDRVDGELLAVQQHLEVRT